MKINLTAIKDGINWREINDFYHAFACLLNPQDADSFYDAVQQARSRATKADDLVKPVLDLVTKTLFGDEVSCV